MRAKRRISSLRLLSLIIYLSHGRSNEKKRREKGRRAGHNASTHRDDGGTRRAGKVLDDLPVGLLDGGVRCLRRVGGVRLRGRCGGLRTLRIEQQLDTGLAAVIAAHVLPETGPSPGAPGSWDPGYRPRSDFTLTEQREREAVRITRLAKCVSNSTLIKTIFLAKYTLVIGSCLFYHKLINENTSERNGEIEEKRDSSKIALDDKDECF